MKHDKIKNKSLISKYKFLKSEDSPLKIVGHKPSKNFKKVFHKIPMLSLGNAFSEQDVSEFIIKNFLSKKIEIVGIIGRRSNKLNSDHVDLRMISNEMHIPFHSTNDINSSKTIILPFAISGHKCSITKQVASKSPAS